MDYGLKCTGLYKDGNTTVGYHITDGVNGGFVDKEQVIYMIQRGQIDNLRLRNENGLIEIRGSGVNLKLLPTMSVKPKAADIREQVPINTNKYNIVKRILYKDKCVGYVLNVNGEQKNVSNKKIIELLKTNSISNATLGKVRNANGDIEIKIYGIGYEITNLPSIYVDANGTVISGSSKSDKSILARAYLMRKPGIIHYETNGKSATFNKGDYVICAPNGLLMVIKHDEAIKTMKKSSESYAPCDGKMDMLKKCKIEFIGNKDYAYVTADSAIKWPIVSVNN